MVKYRKLVDKYRKNAVLGGRQGEEWGKEGGVSYQRGGIRIIVGKS